MAQFVDAKFVWLAGDHTQTPTGDLRDLAGFSEQSIGDPEPGQLTLAVSGLTPDTLYSFQAIGTYAGGGEDIGQILLFQTTVTAGTTNAQDDQVEAVGSSPTVGTPVTIIRQDLRGGTSRGTIHGDELEQAGFIIVKDSDIPGGGPPAPGTDLRTIGGSIVGLQSMPPADPGIIVYAYEGEPGTTYYFQGYGNRTSDQNWETVGTTIHTFTTDTSPDLDEDAETIPAEPGADASTQWVLRGYVTQEA